MENNKRFEEWEKVDCNQCARYWDSSCDGADKRICSSYIATREVIIPEQIKQLNKRIDILGGALIFSAISQILMWVVIKLG